MRDLGLLCLTQGGEMSEDGQLEYLVNANLLYGAQQYGCLQEWCRTGVPHCCA